MKPRKVHIDNKVFLWKVKCDKFGAVSNVNIYTPLRKLYKVDAKLITKDTMYVGIEGNLPTKITPSKVKDYIINFII